MLQSMTGYGDAQLETGGASFLVEIRSLNNRFLKISVKLPDMLTFAEPQVTRMIREKLTRGSINYILHMRHTDDAGVFDINQAALERYLTSLEQIMTLRGNRGAMSINLATLLDVPGVCQMREYNEQEQKGLSETIDKLTAEAIEQLQAMRSEEGRILLRDFQQQCESICKNLDILGGLTEQVVDNYRNRIQQRVDAMLAEANIKLDEELLAKEVALFAERCDINEEIARLRSHLAQFQDVCQGDRGAGRRMDFLTQEMFREANTIASKANDARISQHTVEIKVAIDRLKEQAQNVE